MTLNELARDVHQTAVEHGFWMGGRSFAECCALIHSEVSEALESDRAGEPLTWEPEDKPGKVNGAAGELVDVIIRCMDSLAFMGVDIDEIFEKKAAYNKSRPYKNGKRYRMLTVYEKDNCQACLFTKRTLGKHGVDYEVKPITDEVLAHAAELGFLQAPIVVPDGDWSKAWSGANPTRMKEYTG